MSKILIGKVVSTKMKNTIVVDVERKFKHYLYKKIIIRHKKYKVHNENKDIKDGDQVAIKEVRPISKDKHFIIVKQVKVKN